MTQIDFPVAYADLLVPSARSFTPGTYPETVFEAQNGAKSFIRYGNKPVNAKLNLTFSNIPDAAANSIVTAYHDSNESPENYINMSSAITNGIEYDPTADSLQQRIGQYSSGLKWRFSAPPVYTSVFPGYGNVTCSFVACLYGD